MRDEQAEQLTIEWEPIGTGGRARLVALGIDTGAIADIDVIDLSRASDRTGYARRVAELLGHWSDSQLERELLRIATARCNVIPEPAPPMPTLATAFEAWAMHEAPPAIVTGLQPFDALAGGELPGGIAIGTVTVLAGPPSTGKSALALQLALGAILFDPAVKILWLLGEMSLEALARRAIAVGSALSEGAEVTMTAAGKRSPKARAVADDLRKRIGSQFVILPPSLTVDRIEAAVIAHRPALVILDYLQLVRDPSASDRRAEVDAVVGRIRALTIMHNVATIVVSNLGKSITAETPIGQIGKESSAIDFDADLLLLGIAGEATDENGPRPVKWLCKKHRHGRARDLPLLFNGDSQLFTDPDAAEPFADFADHAPRADR
jgi:replicative DNA helicase